MTIALRSTVRNAPEFIRWAASARKGQPVTYHIGSLSADRATSPALHLLAETVLILAETGFITTNQMVMRLPVGTSTWYWAARTGSGWAPRSLVAGQVDAFTYRALQAMRDRAAAQSAARAIRDHMGCPEPVARAYQDDLAARNLIEPAEPKGWQLSPSGSAMLS